MRKFKALLETQAERKMKCTSRTRVRDPNQYRQTDTQLLGSIHLRFVHRFTFFLRHIFLFPSYLRNLQRNFSNMLLYLKQKEKKILSCLCSFYGLPLPAVR